MIKLEIDQRAAGFGLQPLFHHCRQHIPLLYLNVMLPYFTSERSGGSGDDGIYVQDLILLSEYLLEDIGDPTLVAHWALDETEGDIAQDSAGDDFGLVIGDAIWQPIGVCMWMMSLWQPIQSRRITFPAARADCTSVQPMIAIPAHSGPA